MFIKNSVVSVHLSEHFLTHLLTKFYSYIRVALKHFVRERFYLIF